MVCVKHFKRFQLFKHKFEQNKFRISAKPLIQTNAIAVLDITKNRIIQKTAPCFGING